MFTVNLAEGYYREGNHGSRTFQPYDGAIPKDLHGATLGRRAAVPALGDFTDSVTLSLLTGEHLPLFLQSELPRNKGRDEPRPTPVNLPHYATGCNNSFHTSSDGRKEA